MFNKLIDLLIEFIGLFQCFVYVDEYEKGVVLRQGRFHRTVGPGMRWILPLNLEQVLVDNSKPAPMYLDVQSIPTLDDYACNIQVGVIWRIWDIKTWIIDIEDAEDMLGMLCSGVVYDVLQETKWVDAGNKAFKKALIKKMNKLANELGAEIGEVVIQDFATGGADRIWHEGISIGLGFEG